MKNTHLLEKLCRLVRYDILVSTTEAGSGHPTSSLSAVELMTMLFFGGPPTGGFFRYDLKNPKNILNDRVIFSKGHASPLLYALYHVAGAITNQELMALRKFNSNLEGHPTPRFAHVDAATGSLGQGLSVGVGMALGLKKVIRIGQTPRVYVLLGDSEMSEGQIYEAMAIASYYKLNNLIAVVDVNRLGQRGETMSGWNLDSYVKKAEAFGWKALVVDDGHNLDKVRQAFSKAVMEENQPVMIIAKTVKGKGISFLENKDNWHGKPVPKDMLATALRELGTVDQDLRGEMEKPIGTELPLKKNQEKIPLSLSFAPGKMFATREAYGETLAKLGAIDPNVVVLDAETSNSTYADKFKAIYPERFYEMFIAEQNMISAALGMSKLGLTPFVSSFAAFLTRAFDQIRMAQYSEPNLKIVGSHAGVSIGADGPSQMALEDLAIARSILNSVVLYPADAVSTAKLTALMAKFRGLFYMRTTREKTPLIYKESDQFEVGGSKIIHQSEKDVAVIFSCGITLHEAVKAYHSLIKESVHVAVVDLYSVKPIDKDTINRLAEKTKNVIVVEDHYPAGGLGEAVKSVLAAPANFKHLAVTKIPRSGTSEELLQYEEIDKDAIIAAVKQGVK
jgi:transketolase